MIIVSMATSMINAMSEGGFCSEQEELPESQSHCEEPDCTADGTARQDTCEGLEVRVDGSIRIRERGRAG